MCNKQSPCIDTILRKVDKQILVDLWVLLKENSVQSQVDRWHKTLGKNTSESLEGSSM